MLRVVGSCWFQALGLAAFWIKIKWLGGGLCCFNHTLNNKTTTSSSQILFCDSYGKQRGPLLHLDRSVPCEREKQKKNVYTCKLLYQLKNTNEYLHNFQSVPPFLDFITTTC